MKTHKILILSILFCALFTFSIKLHANVETNDISEQIPEIPEIENNVDSVKITAADTDAYAQMLKAEKFDPELGKKVREYISKLQNNVNASLIDLRKVLIDQKHWKLDNAKYPTQNGEKKETELIDTGKRLTTSTSVMVNDKCENLKALVAEYHSVVYDYLKFKYAQVLKEWLSELQKSNKKTEEEVKVTPFDEVWTKLDANGMKYVETYEELTNQATKFEMSTLIDSVDEKIVNSFAETMTNFKEYKNIVLKATFRAGWSEFGSGWIMLIFGVLTLYGGLTLTFILDFRSRRKAK